MSRSSLKASQSTPGEAASGGHHGDLVPEQGRAPRWLVDAKVTFDPGTMSAALRPFVDLPGSQVVPNHSSYGISWVGAMSA